MVISINNEYASKLHIPSASCLQTGREKNHSRNYLVTDSIYAQSCASHAVPSLSELVAVPIACRITENAL